MEAFLSSGPGTFTWTDIAYARTALDRESATKLVVDFSNTIASIFNQFVRFHCLNLPGPCLARPSLPLPLPLPAPRGRICLASRLISCPLCILPFGLICIYTIQRYLLHNCTYTRDTSQTGTGLQTNSMKVSMKTWAPFQTRHSFQMVQSVTTTSVLYLNPKP